MESNTGKIETTLTDSRDFLSNLRWIKSSLEISKEITENLRDMQMSMGSSSSQSHHSSHQDAFIQQSRTESTDLGRWANNILGRLKVCHLRITDLIDKQSSFEKSVRKP